jgi:hypothetical protein
MSERTFTNERSQDASCMMEIRESVCICVCVCEREGERERERKGKSQTQLGEVRIKPVCTQAAFPLKKAVKHRNQKQRLVINNVYKCGVKTLKTCFLEQ